MRSAAISTILCGGQRPPGAFQRCEGWGGAGYVERLFLLAGGDKEVGEGPGRSPRGRGETAARGCGYGLLCVGLENFRTRTSAQSLPPPRRSLTTWVGGGRTPQGAFKNMAIYFVSNNFLTPSVVQPIWILKGGCKLGLVSTPPQKAPQIKTVQMPEGMAMFLLLFVNPMKKAPPNISLPNIKTPRESGFAT